ncbi:hypothetical protein CRV24_005544 [Beauveria bassiana]|nr:hypothetical protein CRV24_005544 [Beauveria bassiana]
MRNDRDYGTIEVSVRREYFVRKLNNVEGDVKALVEKYKVFRDGGLKLEDAGGDKIRIVQETLRTIMDNFKGEMDSENYETTKNKFEKFQVSSRTETRQFYITTRPCPVLREALAARR